MNSIESSFKRKTFVIVVSVLFISLAVVGVSYSSFSNIGTLTNNFVVENYPITTTFKDNDLINMTLDVIGDTEGLELNGKSFSITNLGDLDVLYNIYIESNDVLYNEKNIKISIDSEKPVVLSELPVQNGKKLVASGIVKKRNEINDVVTHNIKMWAINSQETVNYKISVESEIASDVASDIIKALSESNIVASIDNGLLKDAFGNIRYYGENPNNYVMFNNELWRIVGVFDLPKQDGRSESRIKIVKDDSIETRKFITSNGNEWERNIGDLLYNYTQKFSLEDKHLFDDAEFRIGGLVDSIAYKASDYYNNEISGMDAFNRKNKITSNCGLLTISDYYYASSDGNSGNWLNNGTSYWLMNNDSSSQEKAFIVNDMGIVEEVKTSVKNDVKPVIYLKSTVRFISGDGSKDSPYMMR